MIIEALSLNGQISINDVSEIVGKKNIFSLINSMSIKELIRVDEKIYSKYKPKLVRCIKLSKNNQINDVETYFKNAKAQHKVFEYFHLIKSKLKVTLRFQILKKLPLVIHQ